MKTKNIILLITILISLLSCSDETEYTVILKESGSLEVQLMQNEIPIANETIYLIPQTYDYNDYKSPIDQYAVDYIETDENGNVDFGEVNAGNYFIATNGIEINNKTYFPVRILQIISGNSKSVTIDAIDYVGSIHLTITEYDYEYGYTPLSGVKVAIITEDDYYNANNFDEWMENIIEEKTTDSNGEVSYTLPSGQRYYAIMYITDSYGDIIFDTNQLSYLDKDEEYKRTLSINLQY